MRILGIDIGSTGIKIVEIETSLRKYEIIDYYEIPLEPGEDPFPPLKTFINERDKKPDKIAVSLKTTEFTYRNLTLPTKDKKAIIAAVNFELEDDLPFNLEDAIYDYQIVSQTGNRTDIHVTTTLKNRLQEHISAWKTSGIEPDILTTELWAYKNYLNRVLSPEDQSKPVILIQTGHDSTTFYVHFDKKPVLIRRILWGGKDLTAALCKKYEIPIDQAEKAKLDNGFITITPQSENLSAEQLDFSNTLLKPIISLFQEIRQVELACKNATGEMAHKILLTGGTSLLPGLRESIENYRGIPVNIVRGLSDIALSGVTYSEETDQKFLLAAANALCIIGADRAKILNFRKGAFSKDSVGKKFDFNNLKKPLISSGIIAASFVLILLVQENYYKEQIEKMDANLEIALKSFFGTVSKSALRNYMADSEMLQKRIKDHTEKEKNKAKLRSQDQKSPLAFIKIISSNIPKDIVLDMIEIQVGAAANNKPYQEGEPQNASISFILQNQTAAETLNEIITKHLDAIKKEAPTEITAKDSDEKKWKITFTGNPKESLYGN